MFNVPDCIPESEHGFGVAVNVLINSKCLALGIINTMPADQGKHHRDVTVSPLTRFHF